MIRVTKFVLKRPVTTLLVVLSLFFFGVMSLFSSKLELTPEINMPMLVVMTTYPGASPKDVDELITKEIEENVGTLGGIDTLTGLSSENFSLVLLQYEYGTDMDNAYSDLRKRIDQARTGLPEDANEPVIYELDVNQSASMYVTVKNSGVNNVLNYANKYVVPELEKLQAGLEQFRERLNLGLTHRVDRMRAQLIRLAHSASFFRMEQRILGIRQTLEADRERMERALADRLRTGRNRTASLGEKLSAMNPEAVLERGYTLIRTEEGRVASSAAEIREGDRVELAFRDGTATAEILTRSLKQ